MTRQPDDDQNTFDQWLWHSAELDKILARWRAAEISMITKRRLIGEENRRYYHGDRKSPATGEWLTRMPPRYDLPQVLADALGIPPEAMSAALTVRRQASADYRDILDQSGTDEAALAVLGEAEAAYADILAAARQP